MKRTRCRDNRRRTTARSSQRVLAVRGATLIELLIAMTVFSMVVLGLAKLGLATSHSLTSGRSYMAEWSIAHGKLDSLKAIGWEGLDGEEGSTLTDGHQVRWEVMGDNPRLVVLTVARNVRGRARADTFTTYVAK